MSDSDWMDRILGDARDRALHSSRATIQAQAQQLAELHRELAATREVIRALELELEHGQAAARGCTTRARVIGLIRRLFGRAGAALLAELIEASEVEAVEPDSESERRLMALLERD